jgi:hypothetical protein
MMVLGLGAVIVKECPMTIVKMPLTDAAETGSASPPVLYIELDGARSATSAWDADTVRGKRAEKAVAVATDLLDDAVELARACAMKFSAGLATLGEGPRTPHDQEGAHAPTVKEGVRAPDEVSLELGITLDADFGAVLARARAGAQLQVTLTWQRER